MGGVPGQARDGACPRKGERIRSRACFAGSCRRQRGRRGRSWSPQRCARRWPLSARWRESRGGGGSGTPERHHLPGRAQELKNVEAFGEATAKENPWSSTGGELAGGVIGTAPLVAAAPAAFGVSGASLPVRMLASAGSGAGLGGADAAVRSEGDLGSAATGAVIGGALGGAGPAVARASARRFGPSHRADAATASCRRRLRGSVRRTLSRRSS